MPTPREEIPLSLTHADARELADEIEKAIARVRMDFVRGRRPDLDNPNGDLVLYREIALALARCCVRYGFDAIPAAAANYIDRLEIAIAEQNAKLETWRMTHVATPKLAEGSHQGNGRVGVAPCTCALCRGDDNGGD